MNQLITKARKFATECHKGQVRKYTGEPYIVHPAFVAAMVKQLYGSNEEIAAGWLHDTMEDCNVTYEEIVAKFGQNVARMVAGMTNDSIGNRAERHRQNVEKFAYQPQSVKLIRLCDIGHNQESIIKHDPEFAKVWCAEKLDYMSCMWFSDNLFAMKYQIKIQTNLRKVVNA